MRKKIFKNKFKNTFKKILLFCLAFPTAGALAQPAVSFNTERTDLGDIVWNSPKTAEFTITNSGSDPLEIQKVLASCDCLVPSFPQNPIAPGSTATIGIGFKAETLGHFTKRIAVYTNSSPTPAMLTVCGNVVTEAPLDTTGFPCRIGGISLSTDELVFDDINRGDIQTRTIEVYNGSSTVYKPELMHLPPFLTAEAVPARLMPRRSGKITVTLNSNFLHDMGLTQTSVYLSRYAGDKVDDSNEIGVSAVMLPSAEELAADDPATAPHATISADTLTLLAAGKDRMSGTVTIANTGRGTLQIKALQVSNTALNAGVGRKIAPGKQAKLKITVLRKFLKANHTGRLRVLMITNDPQMPKIVVTVKVVKA